MLTRRVACLFGAMAGLAALAGSALAGTIDLSSTAPFIFSHGAQMAVQFSVWNYGWNNPGTSPFPTSISLELTGTNPPPLPVSTAPGASSLYFPEYLIQGSLESLDGSVSTPLQSPLAGPLRLSPGSLVVTPGTLSGASSVVPVGLIDATAALTLTLSQQIFGADVASRQSSALIVLRNLGSDLVIGAGGGQSLRNAISEPGISGPGDVETSGITRSVTLMSVPEPGTLALTLVLVFAFGVLLIRRTRG